MRALLFATLLAACSRRGDSVQGVPSNELAKTFAPPPPDKDEVYDPIEWVATATISKGSCNPGERHAVHCPARTVDPTVWGTDSYTTDSSVCVAALHAGKITTAGGNVVYELRDGLPAYAGSVRNGVITQSWPAYTCSFEFTTKACAPGMARCQGVCSDLQSDSNHCSRCEHACAAGESCRKGTCSPGIDATWGSNATAFPCSGTRVIVCPPRGTSPATTVWGTDVYTNDSSICLAAVHAGALTVVGGTTTIEMLPGLPAYTGSTRRGVVTNSWGAWSCSYRFK